MDRHRFTLVLTPRLASLQVLPSEAGYLLQSPKPLFLPEPGLDQNPEDHQMGNNDQGRVKRIDIPKGT